MKKYILILIISTFLTASGTDTLKDVGRYQLSTTSYISQKGVYYIVETIVDTKTGKVTTRRKVKASKYKLPYKNRKGKMVIEE